MRYLDDMEAVQTIALDVLPVRAERSLAHAHALARDSKNPMGVPIPHFEIAKPWVEEEEEAVGKRSRSFRLLMPLLFQYKSPAFDVHICGRKSLSRRVRCMELRTLQHACVQSTKPTQTHSFNCASCEICLDLSQTDFRAHL